MVQYSFNCGRHVKEPVDVLQTCRSQYILKSVQLWLWTSLIVCCASSSGTNSCSPLPSWSIFAVGSYPELRRIPASIHIHKERSRCHQGCCFCRRCLVVLPPVSNCSRKRRTTFLSGFVPPIGGEGRGPYCSRERRIAVVVLALLVESSTLVNVCPK